MKPGYNIFYVVTSPSLDKDNVYKFGISGDLNHLTTKRYNTSLPNHIFKICIEFYDFENALKLENYLKSNLSRITNNQENKSEVVQMNFNILSDEITRYFMQNNLHINENFIYHNVRTFNQIKDTDYNNFLASNNINFTNNFQLNKITVIVGNRLSGKTHLLNSILFNNQGYNILCFSTVAEIEKPKFLSLSNIHLCNKTRWDDIFNINLNQYNLIIFDCLDIWKTNPNVSKLFKLLNCNVKIIILTYSIYSLDIDLNMRINTFYICGSIDAEEYKYIHNVCGKIIDDMDLFNKMVMEATSKYRVFKLSAPSYEVIT